MTFFGTVNIYSLRANMSVALVDMVNQTYITSRENNTPEDCLALVTNSSDGNGHEVSLQ